ncbi:glycoside hydrolase family 3 protein [Legionella sp. W05-934-2]|uniref:glycoside hydrolase family 3 protein n=1 Tax=Legionella sp. W05-934-2 TaxID=1198649 RepID=UPI0034625D9A
MLFLNLLYGESLFAKPISLRDKIGQMLIMGFDGKTVTHQSDIIKAINHENIGGVVLFDYDYQTQRFDRNIESPAQVKKLNQDLQYFTQQANRNHHRPMLPLLISVDYEGGQVTRLREDYGFPKTMSAAEIGTKSLPEAEQAADAIAQTLQKSGFNLDFAPDLDINANPNNPIIGKKERSFSNDPATVAKFASVFSKAFLSHGIQCAYKHFPGHGSSSNDSHLGFVDVSKTWDASELFPYLSLLREQQSCGIVMTAHIVNRQLDSSGMPATLSYKMLTGILRKQLSFDGVIMTDDMQMKAISNQYPLEQSVTLAINAGADMLIFGNQLSEKPQSAKQIIDIIESKVQSGEISLSRIDDAYQHITTLKQSIND